MAVRVLHLFGRLNHGGAELRTLDVLEYLGNRPINTHICILTGLPGTLDDKFRAAGCTLHYLALSSPQFTLKFIKLLKTERIDTLHAHVHYASGFFLMLAALAGLKSRIAHFRSSADDHDNSPRRSAQRWLTRSLVDRFATDILAVSKSAMQLAWSENYAADPRCQVIYNGINPQLFTQEPPASSPLHDLIDVPPTTKIFIHVGRLSPVKNHLRLIAIFHAINQLDSNTHLVLIGSGTQAYEQQLHDNVAALDLTQAITFLGTRNDVAHLLQDAHMLLFPSFREGLPGVILEASAAGLPIVASDLPVIKEIETYLPSVKPLSLACTDFEWANFSLAYLDSMSHQQRKGDVRRLFKNSPFNVEQSALALAHIWLK